MKDKKKSLTLWFYFTLIVFGILIFSVFCMVILIALFYGDALENMKTEYSKYIFIPFIFTGVFAGTLVSFFVSKLFFSPIDRINDAFSKVAKGDFTVKLPSHSKIREIDELNNSFNSMVNELSNIETLRNDFVINVSHEFKTPVSAINGYAYLLKSNNLQEKSKNDYIERIISNTNRLVSLTDNILTLSKLENNSFVKESKKFRLDEQIRKEILNLETKWTEKNINWNIEMENVFYEANEHLLSHVWENLISNAIKFSKTNGNIDLSLCKKNKNAVFSIKDYGCGIDKESMEHVFEKFYQGDKTHKQEGNGLGLSLVKRIVDLYGGNIEVSSELNKWTVFTVTLPI